MLYYEDTTCVIGQATVRAIVVLNEKRAAQERTTFMMRLETFEADVKAQAFTTLDDAQAWSTLHHTGLQGCYTLELVDGIAHVQRQEEPLRRTLQRFGKMVLITNKTDLSPQSLLQQYREKDRIEKVFDTLKNDINESRLRVHSQAAMSGKMLITFISLILYTAFMNRLSNARDTLKNMTFHEILLHLRKIRCIHRPLPFPPMLSEISKKQTLIFKALHIPIPSLVINSGI